MQNHSKRERELIVGSPMPKIRYWSSIALNAVRRRVRARIASLWRCI